MKTMKMKIGSSLISLKKTKKTKEVRDFSTYHYDKII